jgi:hypothetical protein
MVRRTAGSNGRRHGRPASATWLGGCRAGFASGSGVLVNIVKGQEAERFYGRVQQGRLSIGVLQTSDGYVGGSWARGAPAQPIEDDMAQRNTIIAAFQAAAKASALVGKSLHKKGDSKSSRFYAQQARLLREQID